MKNSLIETIDKQNDMKAANSLCTPDELIYAIIRGKTIIVRDGLIDLVNNTEYRQENFPQRIINNFFYFTETYRRWDILLLLFTYLPKMGISLPANSPFEFVNKCREESNTMIETEIQKLKLTTTQEQQLKDFDAAKYCAQHDFMADRDQTKATFEIFIKAIFNGTLNHVEQYFKSLLAQRLYFEPSTGPTYLSYYRTIYMMFERCIEEKNTDLLLLLWAWLPKLNYILLEDNPFEIYQVILNKALDKKIILTAEVEHKLKAFHQENYEINFFDPGDKAILENSPPFIRHLERRLFKDNTNAAKAYANLALMINELLKEIMYPNIKFQSPPISSNEVTGNRLLRTIFNPYSNTFNAESITLSNALESLYSAICKDDSELAKYSLYILTRKGKLSVDKIFASCANPIAYRNYSILTAMINSRCYTIIRDLCFKNTTIDESLANEVLACVQKYIIKHKLTENQVYYLLCKDPSMAHKYLLSPNLLFQMAEEDLYPFEFDDYRYRADIYYKGEFQRSYLDAMFKQLIILPTKLDSDPMIRDKFAQFICENLPESAILSNLLPNLTSTPLGFNKEQDKIEQKVPSSSRKSITFFINDGNTTITISGNALLSIQKQ